MRKNARHLRIFFGSVSISFISPPAQDSNTIFSGEHETDAGHGARRDDSHTTQPINILRTACFSLNATFPLDRSRTDFL